MTTIRISGRLTEEGRIEVDHLPEGWQPGEITVELSLEREWSNEELDELLRSEPVPASQIKTGGWEHLGIEDSVEYVEELRRKRQEKTQW